VQKQNGPPVGREASLSQAVVFDCPEEVPAGSGASDVTLIHSLRANSRAAIDPHSSDGARE
jgi:hypothetical protein